MFEGKSGVLLNMLDWMPIKHLTGEVNKAIECMNLGFTSEIQDGDLDWGVVSV